MSAAAEHEFVAAAEVAARPGLRVFEMSEELCELLSSDWSPSVQLTARKLRNGKWELLGRKAQVEVTPWPT